MEQLLIEKIYISDKSKDGTPFVTKKGKPFRKIAIKTEKYGDRWPSDFIWDDNDPKLSWKVGDTVTVVVEEKGQYLNFRQPSKEDLISARIDSLEHRVKLLENSSPVTNVEATINDDIPIVEEEEPDTSDLPF